MWERRIFFFGVLLAGLGLRLIFFFYFPAITDDSRIYADIATNWLQHGVYGLMQGTQIVPTDTRLPGYPAFLAAMFAAFGAGNFRAVMLAQILLDLGTCLLIADLTRRIVTDKAARMALMLAAFCPFLANYAAAVLTETAEIFFTVMALDCAAAALGRTDPGGVSTGKFRLWALSGLAIAVCILLRPDGGILLVAVLVYLIIFVPRSNTSNFHLQTKFLPALIVAVFALAPLVPWTIRNFWTMHHFQPLAPRYANETDELTPRGFNRWVKTWIVDYVSVEEIYWNVPGDKIDATKLPMRAMGNATERDTTLALIADYNQTLQLTPEFDMRFGQLAKERIRAHPVRFYVGLPLLRIVDMWMRPRTEILPPDVRWWEFDDDRWHSVLAVGFGLLNLAYVGTTLWGIKNLASGIRWSGLLVSFIVLRSLFLGTVENPEPRYTLEMYPAVIVLAAAMISQIRAQEV